MNIQFSSLLEAINYLNEQKFIAFVLKGSIIQDPVSKIEYKISDATFVKSYKFEEESDADNVSILHVVNVENGISGYFIDSPGGYSTMEL